MRNLVLSTLAVMMFASVASAQKVVVPSQTNNKNIKITAPSPEDAKLLRARRIKREEAQKLVAQGKAVFVDVRSLDSFNRRHIKGAISLPGSQLIARMNEIPAGKMAITYCACVEEHTAARAVVHLGERGNMNAAALVGGWNEWIALGLPTEGNSK
jgi:rhodanese-related sulfurtransferase